MLKYTDEEGLMSKVRRIRKRQRPPESVHIRRKNLLLDQSKIDRAKRIFHASTETEAIHRALDAVVDLEAFQRELDKGFDALIGAGGFTDRFF
jgi:putative antitoxin of VapBC-like toxin-antitoxin system